tara:strand:+ start:205 stop:438 length:234 start_codon:yes stop_codon:yes gene_type:complete
VKKIIQTPFLTIVVLILLLACNGQTPEEYDQTFEVEFNACVHRAESKCDNLTKDVCTQQAISRCETFLGTKANPVVK